MCWLLIIHTSSSWDCWGCGGAIHHLKIGKLDNWICTFIFEFKFCKKLQYKIKPSFSKYKIRPPLAIFSAFLKKITTTKSSANFLSPEPNGQGFNLIQTYLCKLFKVEFSLQMFDKLYKYSFDGIYNWFYNAVIMQSMNKINSILRFAKLFLIIMLCSWRPFSLHHGQNYQIS